MAGHKLQTVPDKRWGLDLILMARNSLNVLEGENKSNEKRTEFIYVPSFCENYVHLIVGAGVLWDCKGQKGPCLKVSLDIFREMGLSRK